jgi:hypothetical protein
MTNPVQYRKKPVVVDAIKWDGTADGASEIIDWILKEGSRAMYVCANPERCSEHNGDSPHSLRIFTLEGNMDASIGDYVIRGVQGEFYPCKPNIFDATYDKV